EIQSDLRGIQDIEPMSLHALIGVANGLFNGNPHPVPHCPLSPASLLAPHFGVSAADCRAPIAHGLHEAFGITETTADGDAIKRGGVVRQNRFACKTPTTQDSFDAKQLAVVFDE